MFSIQSKTETGFEFIPFVCLFCYHISILGAQIKLSWLEEFSLAEGLQDRYDHSGAMVTLLLN